MSGNFNMYSCRGPYLICALSKLPELGFTTLFVLDFATSTAHSMVEVSVHINVCMQCCLCVGASCP